MRLKRCVSTLLSFLRKLIPIRDEISLMSDGTGSAFQARGPAMEKALSVTWCRVRETTKLPRTPHTVTGPKAGVICGTSSDRQVISERELTRYMSSFVRLSSVCLSSLTFVHPTQAIEIFGNVSTPCGTLAILDLCVRILRRSFQENPSVGGVKHKRGSRI